MGSFGFVKAGSERFPFEYDREVTPVGAGMSRFSEVLRETDRSKALFARALCIDRRRGWFVLCNFFSQHNTHVMNLTVISQRDFVVDE